MTGRQRNRLPVGGSTDRSRPLEFEFNGARYRGYAGDTLASALLANDVRIVARSFKYHRPRGLYSAGEEEPNAVLSVRVGRQETPSARAPLVPLRAGLVAKSQNCFPSANLDLGRIVDFTRALWPAGFYNKTFKWPDWRCYEGAIRRVVGLGRLPKSRDACEYRHANAHCDVLVCGAGPAGLAAALAAGRSGSKVIVAEQASEAGGRLLATPAIIDGDRSDSWIRTTVAVLNSMDNVQLMTSTTVNGYYDHNVLTVLDHSNAWEPENPAIRNLRIRAKQVVVATGAIEQPLVFDGNDRPGIMLGGAVREYLFRYAVAAGTSICLAANNDEAWRTAFMLHDHGRRIPAIIDTRRTVGSEALAGAESRGIPVIAGSFVSATSGARGLSAIRVGAGGGDGITRPTRIACDALAVSGGWNPRVHLYSQAGGRLRYDEELACFVPRDCRQAVRVAGAAKGEFDLARSLAGGFEAGRAAAAEAGCRRCAGRVPETVGDPLAYGTPGRRIAPAGRRSRQWIDLQHDVTAADVELAVRENFVSVEHMKRYTTAGMSIDQGKTGNLNALTLLAELTGRQVSAVGTTTFRPPYMPVPLGAIAGSAGGNLYTATRLMSAHAWHADQGAVFEDYDEWRRPAWYRCNGNDRGAAIVREVLAARKRAGLFDGSPLGKIEVRGPDAAEFLNRIYVNTVPTLRIGHVRYGLMLNEAGVIIDDGVIARLSNDHFVLHTNAANAARIAGWLEEWHQCEWPVLRVVTAPVTTQWAVVTLFGPNARKLLRQVDSDIDFSAEAFPHMQIRTGLIQGSPARVQRVSFSGELSFEVSVPADRGECLFRRIAAFGAVHGLTLVGAEAILVLRMEKGYMHVGTDTDGTTNPFDVGFGPVVEKKLADFVGRRSLDRPHDRLSGRRQLVGIRPVDPKTPFRAGAHVVRQDAKSLRSEGFVTSATISPTLGAPIGLAMVQNGAHRKDEIVTLFDDGKTSAARIVDRAFYDPSVRRVHG